MNQSTKEILIVSNTHPSTFSKNIFVQNFLNTIVSHPARLYTSIFDTKKENLSSKKQRTTCLKKSTPSWWYETKGKSLGNVDARQEVPPPKRQFFLLSIVYPSWRKKRQHLVWLVVKALLKTEPVKKNSECTVIRRGISVRNFYQLPSQENNYTSASEYSLKLFF